MNVPMHLLSVHVHGPGFTTPYLQPLFNKSCFFPPTGFIAFILTFSFGILFSALANLCKSRDTNWVGGGSSKEDRVDPLLFHPIVRSLCCCVDQIHGMDTKTATEEEDLAQILTK